MRLESGRRVWTAIASIIRQIHAGTPVATQSGMLVVAALISPYRTDRDHMHKIAGSLFHEGHVDVGLEIGEKHDLKGLYLKARKGLIPDSQAYRPLTKPRNRLSCASRRKTAAMFTLTPKAAILTKKWPIRLAKRDSLNHVHPNARELSINWNGLVSACSMDSNDQMIIGDGRTQTPAEI